MIRSRLHALPLALALCASLATACHRDGSPDSGGPGQPPEEQVSAPATLEQGWNDATREAFWFTPQGSQVMPYAWFLALEEAESSRLLRSPSSMERFRYIPMPVSTLNKDALPIGFTRDTDIGTGTESLGLTCAACHTAKLRLAGQEVIIDGGPTLADFKGFLAALNNALHATQTDEAKFGRFASAVLGSTAGDAERTKLRADVKRVNDALVARETNDHTTVAYGYARLDAFGGILNNVAATGLGIAANAAPPDAPVSYPFVWDAPQADRVQWNGSALNTPVVGGLIRNVGEVLGVFGRLRIAPASGATLKKGYDNSVNIVNLGKLENWLRELWSPQWPTDRLPALDSALVAHGRDVYAAQCSSCHSLLASRDPARRFKVTMVPAEQIGTDPAMADNYIKRKAKTGVLEGQRLMIVAGERLGPETRTFQIVVNGVVGVLLQNPLRVVEVGLKDVKHARELAKLAPDVGAPAASDDDSAMPQLTQSLAEHAEKLKLFDASTHGYKARPLNGIWATAPYLHNGSVPDLWTLLQPVAQRPKTFHVGSREFDPKNVGLRSDPGEGTFAFDTSLYGNSNAGHSYGTDLPDTDKWALVEYLKTL